MGPNQEALLSAGDPKTPLTNPSNVLPPVPLPAGYVLDDLVSFCKMLTERVEALETLVERVARLEEEFDPIARSKGKLKDAATARRSGVEPEE